MMRTLREARRQHDLAERKQRERAVINDPLVRAVLDRFPGAEIVEVRGNAEGLEH